MRVSIVNPRKKKARKSHKKATKRRNPRKAAKKAAPKRRVAKKTVRKAKKSGVKRKKTRRSKKKVKVQVKRHGRKAGKKRTARKPTKRRKSRKARKNPGKRVRPVMYRGKGKVLKHSKHSKLARKGYRFNPGLKGVVKMKGAKLDIPHISGGIVGFVASGYTGGLLTRMAQKAGQSELVSNGAGLVGNVIGTEVSAYAVHFVVGKFVKPALAAPVARGVRVGGYIALALNAVSLGLKVLNVPLPFRALGSGSPAKDMVLAGLGDLDLAVKGSGVSSDFAPMEYAALDSESDGLNAEINALSQYLGDDVPCTIAGLIGDADL